jgi:putative membrane protein
MNLLLAFAVSLKHKLRFEPYAYYDDISSLIEHLDTFAKDAYTPKLEPAKKLHWYKMMGQYLGVSFATSNPRKEIKRADKPLGNLPLEILSYMSAYVEEVSSNGTLKSPVVLGQICGFFFSSLLFSSPFPFFWLRLVLDERQSRRANCRAVSSLASLTDTMSAAERVLTTPLPIGYNILISQIVLIYVYLLPFQLFGALDWICIPGTVAAAYIILGLAAIGNELENPFGNDVNDLPLDGYCEELRRELDFLTSRPSAKWGDMMSRKAQSNKVLWPLSMSGSADWSQRSMGDIRSALKAKILVGKGLEGLESIGGTTVNSKREEP